MIVSFLITQYGVFGPTQKLVDSFASDYTSKEKIISEIIINNCEKNQIYCIDLFGKIKFSEDSLYDLVHANPIGTKIIAETIFADFNKILNKN